MSGIQERTIEEIVALDQQDPSNLTPEEINKLPIEGSDADDAPA